ncbi:uncharacterized protein LOC143838929 [Paroedura picta]|uniref:uncharacterized protein LOC143838929 n=1 Tax=Paroedura picta TaxID=143630 RepID=UPI0040579F5E
MIPHKLLSCILSCIVFVLLVTVHVGAGWVAYIYTIQTYYTGLWMYCSEDKCSYLNSREEKINVVRSFMLIAVLTCLIAILCSADWQYLKNCNVDFFPQGLMAATCNLTTGILVLVSVVIFDIIVRESKPSEKPRYPPRQWAFYLSCIICVLSLLTGIYDLIVYKLSLWGTPMAASEVSPE